MISTLVLLALSSASVEVTSQSSVTLGADGQLETVSGVLSAPLTGDLVQAARQFALSRRQELKLPSGSQLGPASSFGTRFGGSIHFPQRIDGIDVHGAKVIVTVDNLRRVIGLNSSVASYTHISRQWRLSHEDAVAVASRSIEGAILSPDGKPYGGATRIFLPVAEQLRAGYLVHVSTMSQLQNWYLGVDAESGEVLWRHNRVHHADEAHVYPVNPGGRNAGVGVTPTQSVVLTHLKPNRTSGLLEGDQVNTFNCCPNEGCATGPNAKPKRALVKFQTGNGLLDFDLAICDRYPRASNLISANPQGNYVFTPHDPPTSSRVSQAEPADSDLFVEVNAYYHVNNIYDFIRGLSSGGGTGLPTFQMRDEKRGKLPTIWSNASEANYHSAQQNSDGVYVSNSMSRVDNAAFSPVESMEYNMIPDFRHDTDTLMIYQGDGADFGYDAPVLWHEFVHGVIYSTAAFEYSLALDKRSMNEEGMALHESIADYFAVAFGQKPEVGTYVAPRTSFRPFIRNAANRFSCPTVLQGESHNDSQHFTGALWQARQNFFLSNDEGRTFDAAIYAALVAMTPKSTFGTAANAILNAIDQAFNASMPDAKAKMRSVFEERGVLNCSKVAELKEGDGPLSLYTTQASWSNNVSVPGPYQMKFALPKGASKLRLSADYYGWGTRNLRLKVLAKKSEPMTFRMTSNNITNDSEYSFNLAIQEDGSIVGEGAVDVPCGAELYFTVANSALQERTLANLDFSVVPRDVCEVPKPPEPTVVVKPPEEPKVEPVAPEVKVEALESDAKPTLGPANSTGCGCGAAPAAQGFFGLWALWMWRRRSVRLHAKEALSKNIINS